jgi:hypothetical protein
MAQSAITVTPPNPTPPTNMSFLGTTPPTAPAQPVADDGAAGTITVLAASTASADAANFPSATHEGKGTETVVVAPGSRAEAPTVAVSVLGNYTSTPNKDHASSLSPATNPTLASLTPATAVAGTGNQGLTVTGTGFTPQCRIWVDNQERVTTFISPTSMSTTFPKRPSAGVSRVEVKLGGQTMLNPQNFTWT